MPPSADSPDRSQLREMLTKHFDEEELRDLCADLKIEYADLPATGRAGKIRELIAYMERHVRLRELVERCRELRSRVEWPDCEDDDKLPAVYLEYLVKDLGEHTIRGFSPLRRRRILL